ncbi:MAG TPA: RecQ family ATP-dependent DNA helicase [Thermoanaerobaculia bacterium]|nr:RecQ family ATP-dependent DNA helicase [Thermoanaerobaculia bacterium]
MRPSSLERCLFLDLETVEDRILKIGAVQGDRVLERKGRFPLREALAELDRMADGAEFILGHNLLDHDLPALERITPRLGLLGKPVVDTLCLSPLAFAENPYHRLVKDYKLVRDAVNDPVADARLAGRLFEDQKESFSRMVATQPERVAFYAFCLGGAGDNRRRGLAAVLTAIAGRPAMSTEEAEAWLTTAFPDTLCRTALGGLLPESLLRVEGRTAWAYAAAWLRVAGGSSVLPPWVRLRHPETVRLLEALRERPCSDPGCSWCRQTHDSEGPLRRFFGLESFRPAPAAPDGGSLQRAIVEHGLAGEPLLAVLATGGGKSLCYQLPALVRYLRRGLLTVVISPLQALMQDQVDNLNRRVGMDCAAAINGLLTPPERGAVLERVRLGDVAILYVAPEQLRNRSFRDTVQQREVGCWVFDEAHCLSKWGHDFRPDYLYAARFIRELAQGQGVSVPPVACFTATAKQDVKAEILEHFRRELGRELALFEAREGVEREELDFQVESVHPAAKQERIFDLLSATLAASPGGCAVVYFASRRGTADAARFLNERGLPAAAFHAGLDPPEKRRVLEAFVSGAVPVICATNAFGMGIDKENVRLVIHAEMPGSLESYLQEAGRAGRDRLPSRCVLLLDAEDVERQFKLTAAGRLSRRDIAQILRGLRHLARSADEGEVVVTSGELLRDEEVETDFDAREHGADTKVKTAVAWLERAGFVERTENRTRIFQGRLRVESLDEARTKLERIPVSERTRERWLALLGALMNADPSRGLTADELAELPGLKLGPTRPEDPQGERVLRLLGSMAEAGLIDGGLQLTAWVERRGRHGAPDAYEALCRLERALLETLREAEPDAEDGEWRELSLRILNQRLVDQGLASHPETLRQLLRGLEREGKSVPGRAGSLELAYRSRHHYRLRLLQRWEELAEVAELRRAAGRVVLDALLSLAPAESSGKVRVAFGIEDLTAALRRDLALFSQIHDPLATAERTLLFLHEQGILQLQHGLAVFRQAMTLHVRPEAKGRRYSQGDFSPLSQHYDERTFQVHVMARYAKLALEAVRAALALVNDYFRLNRTAFVHRHFAGEGEALRRATGQESFHRIVESLANPVQTSLVAAPADRNLLVLAGPGAGKTRVVVHRCAYLLRVERVPARAILVLCFNRNAALELRRRLRDLVGDDARGVTIQTYHGLAMRLTGASFATSAGRGGEEPDFQRLVPDAVRLLREGLPEGPADPLHEDLRERLLAGASHILVDEYQDINADQYELVSALAGRTLADRDRKLAILAVGDDDQTIYEFTGANVEFIRRFRADYGAEVNHLLECYRSSGHIVAVADLLIGHNRDRMKAGHPIRVDAARRNDPPGGRWEALDRETRGRAVVLEVADAGQQAAAIVGELRRLRSLDPGLIWRRCAVLARTRRELETIRSVMEQEGIPVSWTADRSQLPPLHRIREIASFLERLQTRRNQPCRASSLEELRRQMQREQGAVDANPWWVLLAELLAEWREETADAETGTAAAVEFLYEALAERRREPTFGDGMRLLPVHAAKGLEFDHVLVADGGWTPRSGEIERERRLYYVAMTRARETLRLLLRADERNPHVSLLLDAPGVLRLRPGVTLPAEAVGNRRFAILGLSDLFLSFAGNRPPSAPLHAALARLQPGDSLEIRQNGDGYLELHPPNGPSVAALSASARQQWSGALDRIETARVVALVEWRSEDCDPDWQDRLRCERWWVPVVEVVYRRPG